MIENQLLKYTLYGTSVIICTEVIYRIICQWRKRLSNEFDCDEIAEVIWTSELTQVCKNSHQSSSKSSRPGTVSSSGTDKHSNGSVMAANPLSIIRCKNKYCSVNNVGRLVELIDNAKYSIDLSMYIFTSYELANSFGRALKRGIEIRIISDPEMVYSSGSQIVQLTKSGVPVRCPSTTMLMHHKFCILDGPSRARTVLSKKRQSYEKRVKGIIMSGSLNWTLQGFGGNWENIIISSNKNLVSAFEMEYERMWIAFQHKLPDLPVYSYKNNSKSQEGMSD